MNSPNDFAVLTRTANEEPASVLEIAPQQSRGANTDAALPSNDFAVITSAAKEHASELLAGTGAVLLRADRIDSFIDAVNEYLDHKERES